MKTITTDQLFFLETIVVIEGKTSISLTKNEIEFETCFINLKDKTVGLRIDTCKRLNNTKLYYALIGVCNTYGYEWYDCNEGGGNE